MCCRRDPPHADAANALAGRAMVERRQTKRLIDWIVRKVVFFGMFTGDNRDGKSPRITVENFSIEQGRYGARAYRAQLSRLSPTELWAEARTVAAYYKAPPGELNKLAARQKREEAAQAHRERQAKLAKRPRLDPAVSAAIAAAARHYRTPRMTAARAWDALYNAPFKTGDGCIVRIEGPSGNRVKQQLRVISDGKQLGHAIRFRQWRKYWTSAKPD
jgi:hypothetical protein